MGYALTVDRLAARTPLTRCAVCIAPCRAVRDHPPPAALLRSTSGTFFYYALPDSPQVYQYDGYSAALAYVITDPPPPPCVALHLQVHAPLETASVPAIAPRSLEYTVVVVGSDSQLEGTTAGVQVTCTSGPCDTAKGDRD